MDAEKFTGERPGWGEGFDYDYARHVAAYRFAATLAAGKRVLDAGCGEGFGTQTLADVADEVLGVDYSPVAVSECRRLWKKPNLRFEQVNLTEPGTFNETFDVVINFQVLEHIDDTLPFLRGLHQRLAPSGQLVLTTPNRLRTVSENPYHVREYTAAELKELLSKVFAKVEITGMHGNAKVEEFESGRAKAVARILRLDPLGIRNLLPEKVIHFAFAKLARIVRRQARPSGSTDMSPEDFYVSPEPIDRALDLVAICSRSRGQPHRTAQDRNETGTPGPKPGAIARDPRSMRNSDRPRTGLPTLLATAVVLVAAFAYYTSFVDYGFNREDEGTLLMQFWRWSTGAAPYRDFHMGYTPGVHFLHKTLMQWFGPSLMPGRWLLCVVNALSATMLFVLASRLTDSWKWGLLAPFLFMAWVPVHPGQFASFNIPYPVWYNVFFFLLTALLGLRIADRPSLGLLFLGGLLAGLGFTFKPNVGLFQLAASAMITLLGFGRPRTKPESALWWAWWLALPSGLLVVFSSGSGGELLKYLSPPVVAAIVLARDAYRRGSRDDVPPLLACALALGAGFAVLCVPWLLWSFSILGREWFLRRALFLGTGFESFYYLAGPPVDVRWWLIAASLGAWYLPRLFQARGWPAWPLPVLLSASGLGTTGYLMASRPMPDGFYTALMNVLEPQVFSAATFVQWLALAAWMSRRASGPGNAGRNDLLGPALVCGLLLYLQIFPRTDFMHWVTAAPLLFPLLAWILQALTLRWSLDRRTSTRRAVGLALALPILALGTIRLGHFLDARWDLVDGAIVRTPETRLEIAHAPLSINVGQAESFRDLETTVDYITSHSAQDDVVFTFPALDFVSYMALRGPGNRHGYYFPGWPGHDAEAEVLASLEKRPPTLAVTLYQPQMYFADASAYYFLFGDFFESHYRRVARLGAFTVLAPSAVVGESPKETQRFPAALSGGERSAIADALGAERMAALEGALGSPDPEVRLAAIREVQEWNVTGDFQPLRHALDDDDQRIRSAAVRAAPLTRSAPMRNAMLHAVAAGAFDSADSVRAIRASAPGCDASCLPLAIPLLRNEDLAVADAARALLTNLTTSRWRSDFWWRWEGDPTPDFEGKARTALVAAMNNLDSDPLLRDLSFGFADKLGLGQCPRALKKWAKMPMRFVGFDFTVSRALYQLARAGCPGDWMALALRWLPIEGILLPRVVLEAARLNPAGADATLAPHAAAGFGHTSALALWMCGKVGSDACLEAARTAMTGFHPEEERVAAAWAWSQLAHDDLELGQLRIAAAFDSSPQVRETAEYGIRRRRVLKHEVEPGAPQ